MQQQPQLVPNIPVLEEYNQVKNEITKRLNKIKEYTNITDENKKEIKNSIAEINKVKDRINRYRIDNTNAFLKNIEPYIEQCKELEKLCSDGVSEIKSKMSALEEQEKEQKKQTIKTLFDFQCQNSEKNTSLLKFEMFFEKSMANKSTSLTILEKQIKEWIDNKTNEIEFIKNNTDEPDVVLSIYFENGLQLTQAISSYQERFKNEAEIKAMIEKEKSEKHQQTFEKTLDICIQIKNLPKSKVNALQTFLDGLGVEFTVSKM